MAQGGSSDPADPSPAEYAGSVRETLAADGWELDQTHVSETTYLLGGRTATAEGTRKRGVVVVAGGSGEELARSHLDYAKRAAKKYDASVVVVHARSGIPGSLAELCRQHGIQMISPDEISVPQGASQTGSGQPPQNPRSGNPAEQPEEPADTSSSISRRTVVGTVLLSGVGIAGWTLWNRNDSSDDDPTTAGDSPATNLTDNSGDGVDGTDDSDSDGDKSEDETNAPVDLTVSGDARLAWQHQLENVESIPYRPVPAGDTVYAIQANTGDRTELGDSAVGISGSNGIVALGASDGTVQWDREWEASGTQRTAGRETSIVDATVLRRSSLILLNRGVELEALKPTDGTSLWRTNIATAEYSYNAMRIIEGRERLVVEGLYSSESNLYEPIVYSIIPETGDTSWRSTEEYDSKPQVGGGFVYFHKDNRVVGFDQRSGGERFSIPKDGIDVTGTVVRDGRLYLLGESDPDPGVVRAHSISDGAVEWRFEIPFEKLHKPGDEMTVTDGTVYIRPIHWVDESTTNRTLYALDAETGDERWRLQEESLFVGSIDITDTAVYIKAVVRTGEGGNREELWAVETDTGRRRWRFRPEASIDKMAAGDGQAYLTTDDAVLYGVDASDGTERWRAEMTGDVTWGFHEKPVIGQNDAVYVSTYEMGSVFKLVETVRS